MCRCCGFHDYEGYAYRGIEAIANRLDHLLAPLPVERVALDPQPAPTEGHVLGTVVMGNDPETSVVDRWMVHHRIRNLLVARRQRIPDRIALQPDPDDQCAIALERHAPADFAGVTRRHSFTRTRPVTRMSALDAPTPIS